MLLFQLLPYFLAVQVPTNETWKHGPEYTFSGNLKMLTSLDQDLGKNHGTNLHFTLKCRPREPDSLRCQIQKDAQMVKLKAQSFNIKEARDDANDSARPFTIFDQDFEIKFKAKGIDSYIFEDNPGIPNWGVNMVRLIANLLNIGVDLSNEMMPMYKGLENSTVGECHVDYKIVRMPIKDEMESNVEKKKLEFELVPLENIVKFNGESIEVNKKTQVKECLRCVEPFFGTRYTLGFVPRDAVTRFLSSESKIFISNRNLTSETINESELFDENRERLGKVLDQIQLSLHHVAPAQTELPKFSSFVHKELLPDKIEDKTRY